jgi:hypothetical protein
MDWSSLIERMQAVFDENTAYLDKTYETYERGEEACQTATLCAGHAKQEAGGKELAPLRAYHLRPKGQDGYAYCNRCEAFWKEAKFHLLPNGNTRHVCKKCQVIINREIRVKKRQDA